MRISMRPGLKRLGPRKTPPTVLSHRLSGLLIIPPRIPPFPPSVRPAIGGLSETASLPRRKFALFPANGPFVFFPETNECSSSLRELCCGRSSPSLRYTENMEKGDCGIADLLLILNVYGYPVWDRRSQSLGPDLQNIQPVCCLMRH
jgi:hypothetical protein